MKKREPGIHNRCPGGGLDVRPGRWPAAFAARDAARAAAVGQPAPALRLPTADGTYLSLADQKGTVVLVDFWASWCAPCRRAFPAVDQLFSDFRSRGFRVMAVNLDEKREDATAFLVARPHEIRRRLRPPRRQRAGVRPRGHAQLVSHRARRHDSLRARGVLRQDSRRLPDRNRATAGRTRGWRAARNDSNGTHGSVVARCGGGGDLGHRLRDGAAVAAGAAGRTPAWCSTTNGAQARPSTRTGRRRGRARPAASASRAEAAGASKPHASARGRSWLVGSLAASAFAIAPAPDWAENFMRLQFHTFQDSRGVTVLSPVLDLDKDFTDRTGLKVKFGVDAHLRGVGFVRALPPGRREQLPHVCERQRAAEVRRLTSWSVGGEISRENFYAADTAMASVSRDLNKGNTTIAGGYSFSFNRPRLHPTQRARHQYRHDAYVSLTQTADQEHDRPGRRTTSTRSTGTRATRSCGRG